MEKFLKRTPLQVPHLFGGDFLSDRFAESILLISAKIKRIAVFKSPGYTFGHNFPQLLSIPLHDPVQSAQKRQHIS